MSPRRDTDGGGGGLVLSDESGEMVKGSGTQRYLLLHVFFIFCFFFKSAVWLDVDVPRRLPQVSDRPSLPLSPKWRVMKNEV